MIFSNLITILCYAKLNYCQLLLVFQRCYVLSNPHKIDVSFTLSKELAEKGSKKVGMEMPREHRVLLQDTSRQSLSTFSEENSTSQLTAEGKVTQKADIQPFDTASYMKLKQ